jgi:putative inorganic carbon (HCO3(-)) transporter
LYLIRSSETEVAVITTDIQAHALRAWKTSPYLQQPFALLLCAALGANFIVVAGHDRQRALEIVVLLLASVLMLMRSAIALDRMFAGAAGKLLAAFFLFGVLGSATAFAPHFAFFEVAVFFLLYLCARGVADEVARNPARTLSFITQAIAVAGALYTFKFFVAYFGGLYLGNALTLDDFTSGFSNIRFFNHAQTATLPLLTLSCCLASPKTKLRYVWLAVATYWWMALFATMGRGTLVGTFAGCSLAAFLGKTAFPYLKQVAWTAALGLLAYCALLILVPALAGMEGMNAFSAAAERTAADPASGRMFLWHRAASLIAAHPLLGVGPMHFAHNASDLQIGAHPHDWLLQIGSEWGLPALACLVSAIVLAMHALWRAGHRVAREDTANQTMFTAFLAGGVAILVDGLVSGLFVMPQSQLAIALYLGCAMGWYRTIVPGTFSAKSGRLSRLIGGALVLTAMVGLANIWPDMTARLTGQALTPAEQLANPGMHWPRLWESGYF